MNTNFIIHEDANVYHSRSKSGEFLSSHILGDFRKSPALYRKKMMGEITETESAAFAIGRATHSLILEGRNAFDKDYVVSDGPINPKTGESFGKTTKAYGEWLASQEKEIISGKDYGFILKLQRSVWLHPIASELLRSGVAEGVVRAEYFGMKCQIRMDWFSTKYGLVDLKTCDDLQFFEYDCKRYGYMHQLAFYRDIIKQATGQIVPVHIIAVEKKEPNSTGVWKLTEEAMDSAAFTNRSAIGKLKECYSSDVWPTGYEDLRILDII